MTAEGIARLQRGFEVDRRTGAQVTAGLDLVPTELRASSRVHRVEPGQNLASIAHQYSASAMQIAVAAQKAGVRDLRQSALLKVKNGVTSLAEINRVTKD